MKIQLLFSLLLVHGISSGTSHSCQGTGYEGQYKVPTRLTEVMQEIAIEYCEQKGKRPLTVTSGVRTASHQAQLMRSCLSRKSCDYYANSEAAIQLQAAYDGATNNKIEAVAAKITEQMNRKEPCYISKHLTEFGLDLERWDNGSLDQCNTDLMGDDLLLSDILQKHEGVANVVYKEASGCTHFHVNFVGWDQIPGLKSCSQ